MRWGVRVLCLIVAAAGVLLAAGPAVAQTYGKAPVPGELGPDTPKNVGFDQTKLGHQLPLDVELYDHDAKPVRLRDAIGGKPTIFVMHYNRCPKLCNQVIQNLVENLAGAMRADPTFVAGGPFNVVLVSIDPKEAPAAGRKARLEFHRQYDRRADDAPGVAFLTANHGQGTDVPAAEKTIHELADAVGFKYALRYQNREYFYRPDEAAWVTEDGKRKLPPEPRGYDYEHSPGVVVVTPDGVVSQYLIGLKYTNDGTDGFNKFDLRMSLVQASGGKIGTVFDNYVAPYCFAYDGVAGHYRLTMRYIAALFAPVWLFVLYIGIRTVIRVRREPALRPGESGVRVPPADAPAAV